MFDRGRFQEWRQRIRPTHVLLGVACLAALVGLYWLYGLINIDALHAEAARLDGGWVFVAITLLPLAGFPVSVLHVIAGVRFGAGMGLLLVGISIAIQLVASHALVRLAPDFFARRVEPLRRRLPQAAHRPLTQFTMLLPGAPYFAQNYVLPLMGVPLGTYLIWGFLIHLVRSISGIIFGDVSDDLTLPRLGGFLLYGIAITVTCAWSFRNLRRQLQDRPQGEGDPRPPA